MAQAGKMFHSWGFMWLDWAYLDNSELFSHFKILNLDYTCSASFAIRVGQDRATELDWT